MTGATMRCLAEPGSQAPQLRPSALPGLEAIIRQRWIEVVPSPDPRLNTNRPAEDAPPHSLAARLRTLAPIDSGLTDFLERLESALRAPAPGVDMFGGDDELDPNTPSGLGPMGAPQACMQALVEDFSRRQRQATVLVSGCVAASCVLTVIGILALANLANPNTRGRDDAYPRANAVTAQEPAPGAPLPTLASASPDRAAKSDSLFLLARFGTALAERRAYRPQLILMREGRPISLAPLIEPSRASYILIRGLPHEARLSAGQRSPRGAWLVKAEDLGSLSLSIEGDARGDYTAEIYALGADALPQGRQRVVFRVESSFGRATADDLNWAATLRDMAPGAAPEGKGTLQVVAPREDGRADVSHERVSEAGERTEPGQMELLASLSD